MKRWMAMCLAIIMVLTMLPGTVFAAVESDSGKLEGTLTIKGTLKEGEKLSADLTKVKPTGFTTDLVKYEWFRVGADGKNMSVGTETTYTLKTEDVGCSLQLTLTGKEGATVTGTISSSKVGPVAAKEGSAPTAATTPTVSVVPETPTPSSVQENNSIENDSGVSAVPTQGPVVTQSSTPAPVQQPSVAPVNEPSEIPTQTPVPDTNHGSTGGSENSLPTINDPIIVQDNNGIKAEITTEALPAGKVGEPYHANIEASGNVVGWELENRVLPKGIVWDENTGTFTGTPEVAGTTPGIMVKATFEDGSTDSKTFEIKIEETDKTQDQPGPDTGDQDGTDTPSGPSEDDTQTVELSTDPETVDFGTLYTGYEDAKLSFSLINSGTKKAEKLTYTLSGDMKDVLVVEEISSVESGGNVPVTVTLKSGLAEKEKAYSSTLTIKDEDTGTEVEVKISAKVEKRIYKLKISNKELNFGSYTVGYTNISSQEIKLSNTGNADLTVKIPSGESFDVDGDVEAVLKEGDSATYQIKPKSGLGAGEYSEELTFTTDEGAKASVTAKVTVKEKENYSFDVYWSQDNGEFKGDFGYAPLGYNDENGFAPHSRNLVIRNTGNKELNFKQPVSNSGDKSVYDITKLDEATMTNVQPGEEIKVAVRPKSGLTADVYDEDIVIDATNDKKDPVVKHVTFTVVKSGISIYQGVSANQGTIKAKNGVEKSQSGLGIPGTVKIKTTSGSRDATVKWNIKDCDYNPDLKEEQSFTVWGEVVLPSDVINPAFVSRVTSIGVRVLAYDAKKANKSENKIYGIAQGDVFQAGKTISFSAEGSGMNRKESPEKGDVRYEPTYWKVTDTNAKWSAEDGWNKAPYSASFVIGNSGSYKLKVTFTKETYDGEKWVGNEKDSDGTDVKSVSFRVKGNANTTSDKKNTVTKVKNAVKTGDETNIVPMILLAVAGVLVIGGAGIVLRNRHKKDQRGK